MNSDILMGKWLEIKGLIKERWGRLTKNDLDQIKGKNSRLLGAMRKKYGYIRRKVAPEYNDGVELAEIVSRISEMRSINKDVMTIAFIARYAWHLLPGTKTGQPSQKDIEHECTAGLYFLSRLPRRSVRRP